MATTRHGFFQGINGDQSSTRLFGFIVIVFSLIESAAILILGQANIVSAATAAGILFTAQASPVMVFLFANKQTEIKQEEMEINKAQEPNQGN